VWLRPILPSYKTLLPIPLTAGMSMALESTTNLALRKLRITLKSQPSQFPLSRASFPDATNNACKPKQWRPQLYTISSMAFPLGFHENFIEFTFALHWTARHHNNPQFFLRYIIRQFHLHTICILCSALSRTIIRLQWGCSGLAEPTCYRRKSKTFNVAPFSPGIALNCIFFWWSTIRCLLCAN